MSTPDEIATTNFIETAIISTIVSTVQPVILTKHPSSDGNWRVDIIRYDCMDYDHGGSEVDRFLPTGQNLPCGGEARSWFGKEPVNLFHWGAGSNRFQRSTCR
jgi:hypothetical protein